MASSEQIILNVKFENNSENFEIPHKETIQFPKEIINNPENYCCEINKFNIDTSSLPLFRYPFENPKTDLNINDLETSLKWFQSSIANPNFNTIVPTTIVIKTSSQIRNDQIYPYKKVNNLNYYDPKSEWFLEKDVYLKIINSICVSLGTSSFTVSYNSLNKVFEINGASTDTIYINGELKKFLENIQCTYLGKVRVNATNSPDNHDWYRLEFLFNNVCKTFPYLDCSKLSPAKKIAIISNNIPVNSEIHPMNVSNNELISYSTLDTYSNKIPIFSTFYFSKKENSNPYEVQSGIIYSDNNIENGKYLNLKNLSMVNSLIDFSIYWIDEYNNFYPLKLKQQHSSSFQLIFFKRK